MLTNASIPPCSCYHCVEAERDDYRDENKKLRERINTLETEPGHLSQRLGAEERKNSWLRRRIEILEEEAKVTHAQPRDLFADAKCPCCGHTLLDAQHQVDGMSLIHEPAALYVQVTCPCAADEPRWMAPGLLILARKRPAGQSVNPFGAQIVDCGTETGP